MLFNIAAIALLLYLNQILGAVVVDTDVDGEGLGQVDVLYREEKMINKHREMKYKLTRISDNI